MNATVLLLAIATSAVLAAVPRECHSETEPGVRYPSAEVYFVRWDKLTSSALSAPDVRKSYDVRAEIRELGLIQQLRAAISELEGVVPALGRPRSDARRVIDFPNQSGGPAK